MSIPLAKPEEQIGELPQAPAASAFASRSSACARVYSALAELPDSFMRLFEDVGRQSAFLTLPWFQNFTKTAMDAKDRLRIYGVSSNRDDARGMLLMRSPTDSTSLLAPRKLDALTNYYSCYFAPHLVGSPSETRDSFRAIVRHIAQEKPRWDAVGIKLLLANSELFAMIVEELEKAGYVTQTYFCAGNWFEPINGRSFREYFDDLRSSVRNIAKSKQKKIERSGQVRWEIITGTEGLEAGIASYSNVYATSWKVAEPYAEFIPGLLRTCAAQGTLRLGLAYVDGEPAAAQIWIVHAGVASIYKIAYNPKFRDLSVGTYLTTKLMEHAIDVDHVREVDYLTGDDKYKKDWMSQRRELWGILALNPRTPRGLLAIARHVGGRAVKRAAVSLAKYFQRSKAQNTAA